MIIFVFMIRNQAGATLQLVYIYRHGYVSCLYIMYIMYTP